VQEFVGPEQMVVTEGPLRLDPVRLHEGLKNEASARSQSFDDIRKKAPVAVFDVDDEAIAIRHDVITVQVDAKRPEAGMTAGKEPQSGV
jgi:hypothetical protein